MHCCPYCDGSNVYAVKGTESYCGDCALYINTDSSVEYDVADDDFVEFPNGEFPDGDALASAGFGTDEDYGYFGGDDW